MPKKGAKFGDLVVGPKQPILSLTYVEEGQNGYLKTFFLKDLLGLVGNIEGFEC